MVSRLFALIAVLGVALLFFPLLTGFGPQEQLSGVAAEYVQKTPEALGAANVVTAVIVTYRGLDTLGEVTVLFLATAGIGFLLRRGAGEQPLERAAQPVTQTQPAAPSGKERREPEASAPEPSEILQSGSRLLVPLIVLFGAYVFIHGHLTPGGGFQGGVVIASAALLFMLAGDAERVRHGLLLFLEAGSGSLYVVLGILGLAFGAGFLDSRLLPTGEFGTLFSAGTIPLLYSLIGLKVGAELTGTLKRLGTTRGHA